MNDFHRAVPIPIITSPNRHRPTTVSSDGSPPSPPTPQTPTSPFYPTTLTQSSPTSSPMFSYIMSTSPKSSASASFPYRRPPGFGAPPVFEGMCQFALHMTVIDNLFALLTDDDSQEIEVRGSHHQRRATTGWAGNSRGASQRAVPAPPVIEAQQARGAGVLRRLSLGGGFGVCRYHTLRCLT